MVRGLMVRGLMTSRISVLHRSLLRTESHLNELPGLMRSGFPPPLTDGIGRGLNQNWMTTFYFHAFDNAIAADHGLNLNDPFQIHTAGPRGILRNHFIHNLAITGRLIGLPE